MIMNVFFSRSMLVEMMGENPMECADYARMVNERHFGRLAEVIEKMPEEKLVIGGQVDASSKFIG